MRMLHWLSVRRRGLSEFALVGALYVLYCVGRTFADHDLVAAQHRGAAIQHAEQFLHIDVEGWLNHSASSITWLGVGMSFWYATLHYLVTPAVLVWAYRRHQDAYARIRNALAIACLIGLSVYVALPTAPPRLMHEGFVDTLARYSSYGWWSDHASAPAGLGGAVNQLAAMPSLHVGWTVWVAWSAGIMAGRKGLALGCAYVAGTTFVVLGTGNHWVLDTVAGAATTAVGIVVSGRLPWLRAQALVMLRRFGRTLVVIPTPAYARLRVPVPRSLSTEVVGERVPVRVATAARAEHAPQAARESRAHSTVG